MFTVGATRATDDGRGVTANLKTSRTSRTSSRRKFPKAFDLRGEVYMERDAFQAMTSASGGG